MAGKMKGIRWPFIVAVLLLGAVLTSCSESNRDETEEREEITVSIYDRGNIPSGEGTPSQNRWTEWINANAPVKVKFVSVPRTEEEQKYNTLLASGKVPDLIFTWTPPLIGKLYSQNLLLPLDDLVDKFSVEYRNILRQYPALRIQGTRDDGKLYQLGAVSELDVQVAMLMRADWLRKLHLDIPATTEELFDVMRAFAEQDPDGNGKKDTYGFHLSTVGGQIVDYLFGSGVSFNLRNGQFVHNWESAVAAVAYKKRMYDANLVDKYYLTDQNGEKALQDFVTGKLGIYGLSGIKSSEGLQIYETLKSNIPDAEVIAIPLPRSKFGQFSPDLSPPYYMSAVVNAHAGNPEAVMKYVDFLLQKSTQQTLKYGIEGIHWKADAQGCPVPIDVEKNIREVSWAFDFSMLSQPISEGSCLDFVNQLNPKKAVEKEYMEIIRQAREAYLSPERPLYQAIDVSSSPDLPEELNIRRDNGLVAAYDIFAKAIVGGASYSIEQAAADAMAAWEKAGGKAVDEAVARWYSDNKDHILLTKDYYPVRKDGGRSR